MSPLLVTAKQAAEILGVSTNTIYTLAADDQLDRRYIGKGTRNFRLTYESLQQYVAGLPTEAAEAS